MYEAEKKQEVDISIHSLRMEGDKDLEVSELRPSYFNPLPPHGGRPFFFYIPVYGHFISIHSLRMEGDYPVAFFVYVVIVFQSTPSAWRETSTRFAHFANKSFQSTPSAWRETTVSMK